MSRRFLITECRRYAQRVQVVDLDDGRTTVGRGISDGHDVLEWRSVSDMNLPSLSLILKAVGRSSNLARRAAVIMRSPYSGKQAISSAWCHTQASFAWGRSAAIRIHFHHHGHERERENNSIAPHGCAVVAARAWRSVAGNFGPSCGLS